MPRRTPGIAVCALSAMMAFVGPACAEQAAAPARNYSWYGELVSYNAQAKTAEFKVPFAQHIVRYVDEFKPGDHVVITWATSREREAGDVISLARYDKATAHLNYGYVLPVDLASVDKAGRTLSFRVPVPAAAGRVVAALRSGSRVKVTAPFDQSSDTARLLGVAAIP